MIKVVPSANQKRLQSVMLKDAYPGWVSLVTAVRWLVVRQITHLLAVQHL
jgi:hypothetical protein